MLHTIKFNVAHLKGNLMALHILERGIVTVTKLRWLLLEELYPGANKRGDDVETQNSSNKQPDYRTSNL